ncbi:MAG: 6-bladed beta-propeller [Gammaproteobacteria bacterium]|nr:6-bladed beta-propeller [Gammaproteobacteria bacterium]
MIILSRVFFTVLVSSILLACAQVEKVPEPEPIYWPAPPDPPRFVYETSLKTESSVRGITSEMQMRRALTGGVSEGKLFRKPFGVAARAGLVVVGDTVSRQGVIINLRRQKIYHFGRVGELGKLMKPGGIALGVNNEIFVADITARQVLVYDDVGMYLRSIGGPKEFDRPVDVAVTRDGSRVYVVDAGGVGSRRHRVLQFDSEGGELLSIFGTRGGARGEFNLPTGIAIAPNGNVLVLDSGNFRIQEFSADGQFLKMWGEVGTRFGDFARPRGIAIDGDGNVYVADAAFRNMQVFDSAGRLLLTVGPQGRATGALRMGLPAGVAVDERGFVFMVDQLYGQIDVLRRLPSSEMRAIMDAREKEASDVENSQ